MSFQSAKQFIVDFYTNPAIRIKIFKIQNKKINQAEQINHILTYARNKGYNFSLFDLIKAVRFKKKLQITNHTKLKHIFGGTCLNYESSIPNKKEKSIEQMLST